MTVAEAVDFVMEHRTDKVFRGWSANQIAFCIANAIAARAFAYALGDDGRIVGLCTGEPDGKRRVLRISHCLTVERGALAKLLAWYHAHFEGWTIAAKRRGKEVVYSDTAKLVRRLERAI